MKKIITGMGNSTLGQELKKYIQYDVLFEDAFCQDILITYLEKAKADTIIVSALLQGRWTLEEFIGKIRKVASKARVIIVTDEIDEAEKRLLEDYNVLDIFLDSKVEIKDIMEAIDREDVIKKKYEMVSDIVSGYDVTVEKNEQVEKKVILEKLVQKQEVIAIAGTNGSGKSTFAVNFCKVLSQKSDAKILLIDLDTLSGNLAELLQIDRIPPNLEIIMDQDKKCGLNYASELILKNRFDANVFEELMIPCGGFDVLTGNHSLHYCQNVLNIGYYEKILKCAKEKYDFIVIDTSSNIFLDATKWALENATRIFFVAEANQVCLKKAEQLINIIVQVWGIWKKKMQIIVNKKYKNEYENESISEILDGIEVIGEVKQNEENSAGSYEKILEKINYIPKKKMIEKLINLKNEILSNKVERGLANAN